MHREILTIATQRRGTIEITAAVADIVRRSGIGEGQCHLFIQHTSASLILCENAARAVQDDLETFMAHMVRDGDPMYRHNDEGPDDMPAHVRSVLTHVSLTLPVSEGRCLLGTWQGIYLWEHRLSAHRRRVVVTVSES